MLPDYRKQYYKGELEQKNAFASRALSEEPKCVQKHRNMVYSKGKSTFLTGTNIQRTFSKSRSVYAVLLIKVGRKNV